MLVQAVPVKNAFAIFFQQIFSGGCFRHFHACNVQNRGVNICNFRLSRQKRGGEAVMTIEVDGTFGPEINERIKTLDNVFSSIMLQPI